MKGIDLLKIAKKEGVYELPVNFMEENGINAIFLGNNPEYRVYYVEELGETFYQSPKITTKPKLTKKQKEIILSTLYDRMDEIENNELEGNPQLNGDYSLEDFKTLEEGYKNLQELLTNGAV